MMQIDRRFADYGLTGGFFLICQLGPLWVLGYWPSSVPDELEALSKTSLLAPIIAGLAGALAVIAAFVVGLILDLLASLFRGTEMTVFARHLDRNSDWMADFIEAHKAYCGDDYETFQRGFRDRPPLLAMLKQSAIDGSTLWRRESRVRYVAAIKINWGLTLALQYERLLSFFVSYVMGQSGSAQLALFGDQYSLWRTARALAAALWLLISEALIIIVIVSIFFDTTSLTIIYLIIIWCFQLLGMFVIYLIIRGIYYRLCFTLFSLIYVAFNKQIVSPRNAEPAP